MVWRGDDTGRVAKSLLTLIDQIDAQLPNRDKSWDGTLGDAAHQARHSDHNRDDHGVVRALDITHSPARGFDSYRFADFLREHWDDRVQYIISNSRIANADVADKAWRPYHGENPHDHHVHISARKDDRADDARPWDIAAFFAASPPAPPKEGHVLIKFGDHGPAVAELQTLLGGLDSDGYFGKQTDAAVRSYQSAHGLNVDGVVGPKTWAALLGGAPAVEYQSGKGSWYSQFEDWHDGGDRPNSNALGVPDDCQGISFYDSSTLGHWFEVLAPNGVKSIEQQTDIGPAPWTGRLIDISAVAAKSRFHYAKKNFPTNGVFRWRRIDAPKEVANLNPKEQAIKYYALRKDHPMVDDTPQPQPIPPPQLPSVPGTQFNEAGLFQFIDQFKERAKRALVKGVLFYNAVSPDDPIKPADIFSTGSPPTTPPGTLGSEHVGILGLLTTLLMQSGGILGHAMGPDATTAGSLLTMLFGALAGGGTISKIAPTLKVILSVLAKIFVALPK